MSNYWEDYKRGSSDYPVNTNSQSSCDLKRSIDKPAYDFASYLQALCYDSNGNIDPIATSACRLNYVRFPKSPIRIIRGERHYRKINYDYDTQIITIEFTVECPEAILAIDENDTIPIAMATQYYRRTRKTLRSLLNQNVIRGKTMFLNLLDCNRHFRRHLKLQEIVIDIARRCT